MTEEPRRPRRRVRVAGQSGRPPRARTIPESRATEAEEPGFALEQPSRLGPAGAEAEGAGPPIAVAELPGAGPSAEELGAQEAPAQELEAADAPDEQPSSEGRAKARRLRDRLRPGRMGLPVVLASVVAALAVVTALLSGEVSAAQRAQDARLPALAAAETAATAALSVDYRRLSGDVSKANAYLTPSFRGSYDKFRASFAPTYTKYHTVIAATVTGGGLRNVTANSAVALLFIDQVTTGTNRNSPRVDQDRVRVTMVRDGSHWLLAGLAAL